MVKTMAKVFGYVFLLVGVLGFIPGITVDNQLLGIFHVDAVHNIVHLLTGAIALWASMGDGKSAKTYFQVFGVIYAIVAILGFISGDAPVLGFLANDMADAWLHTVIAVVALYMGFGARD